MEEWNLWGTTAPGELARCEGVAGGRDEAPRRPAPRWFGYKKSSLWLGATLFYSPFGRDQAYKRISGQRSTKRTVAPARPPSSWGLDGCWEGARRHEALIRQLRAHGQIHCHVSVMSASSVHVIGGAFQSSWPA